MVLASALSLPAGPSMLAVERRGAPSLAVSGRETATAVAAIDDTGLLPAARSALCRQAQLQHVGRGGGVSSHGPGPHRPIGGRCPWTCG
jgi:hypothetical protein